MWGAMGNSAFRRIEREAERINRLTRRKRRAPKGRPCGPKLHARGRAFRPRRPLLLALLHALLYLALALGLLALTVRFGG